MELHSPIYRKKYIEFLKINSLAVPFATDKNIFEKYAKDMVVVIKETIKIMSEIEELDEEYLSDV